MFDDLPLYRNSRLLSPVLQLLAAVMICVVLPFVIITATLPQGWHDLQARHAAVAALVALVVGFWLHRNVGQLPGTRESSGILPAYLISFGATLTVILIARISYSRGILIAGFGLAQVWFFLVYLITQRRRRLRLGIVEGGHVGAFVHMRTVDSVVLALDTAPAGLDAITADFRVDHSSAWQSRLADYVLAGMPVYHSKDLYESLTGRAELEHLSENNLGALGPQTSLIFAKTLIDRALALPALALMLPLMVLTAVIVRLDSPGPALFRQARTGYRGRQFTVFKFRTMHIDQAPAEEDGSVDRFITRPNDARITRVGHVLRRSRIDELPQIINVLLGQMSWIGPRPEACPLSQWYTREIPFYRYRHVVRPGITGWAQVNQGHVADVSDVHTKLQYDFYYIRNFSVWLDLLITAKTVKTMLTGRGSR